MAVAETILENTLAEELERWFYEYKQLWRSVSRESELFRIQNVINCMEIICGTSSDVRLLFVVKNHRNVFEYCYFSKNQKNLKIRT